MADPWLTIIGLGEDGLAGLSGASRDALAAAEVIFGGPRHLTLAAASLRGQAWPIPFDPAPLLACRGRRVVLLASGDPFWSGAGGVVADLLDRDEWTSHPALSSFQLAANAVGWRMEDVICLPLHARDFRTALARLHPGARLIVTLRHNAAPAELADWLTSMGFGETTLHVMERLGGPHQRIRTATAGAFGLTGITAPVLAALDIAGPPGLPQSPGLPDELFASDGQITKSPIRALTLAALAPRPGARLWDLGAGNGTISVEWCLAGGHASAVERNRGRAMNIQTNADAFGVASRLSVVAGANLDVLSALPRPDAVFVGGGGNDALFSALWAEIPPGTRLVANAVTLETEALLARWQAEKGGTFLRFEISHAVPLGTYRSWEADRPVTQWSVAR
jgi:precorrin-6B C5,15-methyltransferase / cobalt-precorrin-6B C5,C15-methyltransferase